MNTGTVKWCDAAKGFGFVVPKDGGNDIYLHAKALQKAGIAAIDPGAVVSYSIRERGGKQFIDEIEIVAVPAPRPKRLPTKPKVSASVDDEDAFER